MTGVTEVVVVCGGRQVDDHLRPVGNRCGRRFRAPGRVGGLARMAAVDRLVRIAGARQLPAHYEDRLATAGEVVEMARAGGWAVPDPGGAEAELVGTCPACRRPAPEVTELVKERRKARST